VDRVRFRAGKVHPPPIGSFTQLADEFTAGYLAWRPAFGTSLGLHEYDGRVGDFSRASIDREIERLRRFETKFRTLPGEHLSAVNGYDLRILQSTIRSELSRLADMDVHRRNPMTYADVIDVNIYIKRTSLPSRTVSGQSSPLRSKRRQSSRMRGPTSPSRSQNRTSRQPSKWRRAPRAF
jgi:hypothetical protein